jgi:diguanylate cyclase (GGDEF)-like protein/PAS domain S-box-containing protein
MEEVTETPRDSAFCAHTILGPDLLEVPDATVDERFAENPLVTGEPAIRFYAGVPITLADGLRVGSVCVIDRHPRVLSDTQRAILGEFGKAAAAALEQRQLALDRARAREQQREAEELLAEDRLRLINIIESMHIGTWEWHIGSDELLINRRWAEIIGYAPDELGPAIMATWRRHAHPGDWPELQRLIDRHLRGDSDELDCDLRMLHQDGSEIWVRCFGRIVHRGVDGEPLLMCGMLADTSRAKEIEQRLQASEAFLDRTGRLARVGGWELDLEAREFTFSDQACRIHEVPLGYRPTMQEGLAFYAATERETIETAVRKAAADGRGWDLELPLVTARGNDIWVRIVGTVEQDGGRPRWLVGALQEITARRRAIQGLEVSERRFRKLFQHSLGLICTHDLEGNILSLNPASAKTLGYSVAELLGRNFLDLIPAELHSRFEQYLERIIEQRSDSGVIQLSGRDGTLHTWQYHNVIDNEGDETYVLGHAQDITDRLHHEQQLRELSIRDPLTGCFNRRFLSELEGSVGEVDVWGCIAIDLDRFKLVNDTCGHQRGDEVLVEMSRFLTRHVRKGDNVVRSGGDEFLILLKDADEAATGRIVAALDEARPEAPIGFTLGHAVRHPGETIDATLGKADKRLYETRALRRS